jgi:hypothetical protein
MIREDLTRVRACSRFAAALLMWMPTTGCDVQEMSHFFWSDVDFCHDKDGPTMGLGPLTETFQILSGEHYFYTNDSGKPEYRDGWAKFFHLWLLKDGTWKKCAYRQLRPPGRTVGE